MPDMEDVTVGELTRLIGYIRDDNKESFRRLDEKLDTLHVTLVSRESFDAEKRRVDEKFVTQDKQRASDRAFARWAITTLVAVIAILATIFIAVL
jgi:hypothetical protein